MSTWNELLFRWFTQNTLAAIILAGGVILFCRLFGPGPATRHACWLVVFLKLVTPPLFYLPVPFPGWLVSSPSTLRHPSPSEQGEAAISVAYSASTVVEE